jgi:Na+-driven multidrug efflux pump
MAEWQNGRMAEWATSLLLIYNYNRLFMSNTHAGLCTTGVVALCGAVVYELFAARLVLGWLAGNAEVLKLAADVSLPTALCMLGFSFMMVSIQLLNSCGKNTQGTAVAFCACWVVGITASLVLALVGIEGWVKGKTALLYCELHNNRPKTAETSAIRVS